MPKDMMATVSSKGQVTLPKPVRELLHIQLGDHVRFEQTERGVLLTKIALEEPLSDSDWKSLERAAKPRGKRYKDAKRFLKDLDRL